MYIMYCSSYEGTGIVFRESYMKNISITACTYKMELHYKDTPELRTPY